MTAGINPADLDAGEDATVAVVAFGAHPGRAGFQQGGERPGAGGAIARRADAGAVAVAGQFRGINADQADVGGQVGARDRIPVDGARGSWQTTAGGWASITTQTIACGGRPRS